MTGNWKRVTTMPDLGDLAGPQPRRQHIVDHGLVQDAEGNWRLVACLRGTAVGRLLYGWKSPELFVESWEPVGVVARAQPRFGERVNTKVGLDKRRAAAGLEKYQPGKEFDPRDSLKLMETAASFDPQLMKVVRHLGDDDAEQFPTWQTLVNATAAADR